MLKLMNTPAVVPITLKYSGNQCNHCHCKINYYTCQSAIGFP